MTGIRAAPDDLPGAWAERGACRDKHRWFFPPEHERDPDRIVREAHARQLCAGCPVRDECTEWAMQPSNPAGDEFAAGMSKRERSNARSGTPALF